MIFQILQAAVAVLILFFVFDIKHRGESNFDSGIPLFIAILLPLYCLGYVLVVFSYLDPVTVFDWMTLILTFLGLALIARARFDLRGNYAWPGQFKESLEFVRTGIYAHLRHPIYTGISIFLIGTLFTVVVHSHLIPGLLLAILSATILALLASMARYEEVYLRQKFGELYITYSYEVHAVFPLFRRSDCEGKDVESEWD